MELSRRQFACSVAFLTLLAAYFIALPHFTPPLTSLAARAAMAEANVCAPDAPIIERDGKVTIGGYEFIGASFVNPGRLPLMPSGGVACYGNFYFQPEITSWLPGGRWKVYPTVA